MPDNVMREFSHDVLAFQAACGLSDQEFAGMLLGAAAVMCHTAGIPKGHMIAMACACYDGGKVANDA